MIINNLKELREVWKLSNWDRINFWHITMIVCYDHFYSYWSSSHDDMVKSLFGSVEKWSFCSDAYWYTSTKWIFPNYKENDFGAAYRVVEKIYVEILWQKDKPKFKKWDIVRIRNWQSMMEEFWATSELWFGYVIYLLQTWSHVFTDRMKHLCWKDAIITRIHNNWEVDLEPISWDNCLGWYYFNTNMIEHVYSQNVSMISDIENKTNPSLSKEIWWYPIETSDDWISFKRKPFKKVDICHTKEKKKRIRFKIQSFLNDRNWK